VKDEISPSEAQKALKCCPETACPWDQSTNPSQCWCT